MGIPLVMGVGVFINYYTYQRFVASSEETTGRVVDVVSKTVGTRNRRTVYCPILSYYDKAEQRRTFTSDICYPSAAAIPEVSTVYFQKDNPDEARSYDSRYQSILSTGILLTTPFLIIGGTVLFFTMKGMVGDASLMKKGRLTTATFVTTEINDSVKLNGKHPYKLKVKGVNPVTGKEEVFTSKNIYEQADSCAPETKFNVYVHPDKPRKYFVDPQPIV